MLEPFAFGVLQAPVWWNLRRGAVVLDSVLWFTRGVQANAGERETMTEHVRADAEALAIRGADGVGASGVVVGAATDVGRLRTINEDGYLAIAPAFVVVDGMGGHAAGRMNHRHRGGDGGPRGEGRPGGDCRYPIPCRLPARRDDRWRRPGLDAGRAWGDAADLGHLQHR